MSANQVVDEVDNQIVADNVADDLVECVPLNADNDYEIGTTYPFIIRKRDKGFIPKELIKRNGYVYAYLNRRKYYKHRLIAIQFLQNQQTQQTIVIKHLINKPS